VNWAGCPRQIYPFPVFVTCSLRHQLTQLPHQKRVNASHADYLFHFDDTRPYDLGEKTLNCGRHQDSFKAWLSWKVHGDKVSFILRRDLLRYRMHCVVLETSFYLCLYYRLRRTTDFNYFRVWKRESIAISRTGPTSWRSSRSVPRSSNSSSNPSAHKFASCKFSFLNTANQITNIHF
jgi:hypothetical protein